eukprot:m.37411 g.37411  ORF g.37411 m.37411 type:complete len:291 (-) comp11379_c0_seq2:393-1265(-)
MADIVVNQQGMALPMRLPRKQKVLSTVAIALTPELDKEREIRRKGSQKNHMQENVRKLREKQAALRREKQEVHAEEPFKPARSMYTGNVEARVFKDAEQKSQPQGGKKHEFLKKHEKQGAPSTLKSPVVKRPSSASASTPTRQGRSNLNQSASQDLGLVIQGKASRPSSASGSRPSSSSQPRKTKPGQVPQYLKDMKAKKAEAEALARKRAEDPDCPDHHVRLSSSKIDDAIRKLHAMKARLGDNLQMLPMSRDTLRLREYREALESDMVEIDEAINYLRKHKVYVPIRT